LIVGASRSSSGLKIYLGDHVPFRGDFDPLKELYDLRNMLESFTRQSSMVSLGFLDKLKYWNMEEDMEKSKLSSRVVCR
jgi:hypothetical protein